MERQGSNERAKDPPTQVLSQYSERSSCLVGTIATAMDPIGVQVKGCRDKAAMTPRNWGDLQADLFRVSSSECVRMSV